MGNGLVLLLCKFTFCFVYMFTCAATETRFEVAYPRETSTIGFVTEKPPPPPPKVFAKLIYITMLMVSAHK